MRDFFITDYRAPDDNVGDVTPSIVAAAEDVKLNGGGRIIIPPRPMGWRFKTPCVLDAVHNVTLEGPGKVYKDVPGALGIVDCGPQTWPTLLMRNSQDVTIRDFAFAINDPDASTTEYQGDPAYGALVGLDNCGDVLIEGIAGITLDGIVIGTPQYPRGVRKITVRDCDIGYSGVGVKIHGGYYVDIDGGHWQDSDGVGVGVLFVGPMHTSSTDGLQIRDLFIEHCNVGVRLMPFNHSVANLSVRNFLFDGVKTAGIWLSPKNTGMVNVVDITAGRMNCLFGAYPILIDPNNQGQVHSVHVNAVTIVGSGRPDIVLSALAATQATNIFRNTVQVL